MRGLTEELDDRRRAAYLFNLAYSYRETGDYEGALRAGYSSLTLFQGAAARIELASLENDLALAHMKLGNLAKADEFAGRAHDHFVEQGDERLLAHVIETRAQIEAARENWPALARAGARGRRAGRQDCQPQGIGQCAAQRRPRASAAGRHGRCRPDLRAGGEGRARAGQAGVAAQRARRLGRVPGRGGRPQGGLCPDARGARELAREAVGFARARSDRRLPHNRRR